MYHVSNKFYMSSNGLGFEFMDIWEGFSFTGSYSLFCSTFIAYCLIRVFNVLLITFAVTVCIRTLVFPVYIRQRRDAVKNANHAPSMMLFQKKMRKAQLEGNNNECEFYCNLF